MKTIWVWVKNNLSILFGIIGIGLTLYFGVFYIPSWIKDVQNEKIRNAQLSIEQSVKELIYSDSICNLNEIELLLHAKEISLNDKFPLSVTQILICVQESFMQDKFLPLEERKLLIHEIEILKEQVKPELIEVTKQKTQITGILIIQLISVIATIFGVIIGIISFYTNFKREKEKQDEIDNQVAESESILYNENFKINYIKGIYSILHNTPDVEILAEPPMPMPEFDIYFRYSDKYYYVQVKYLTKSKVGLSSIQRFLTLLKGREGNFWFIYNTDLTKMVENKVEQIRQLNEVSIGRRIQIIRIAALSEFEREIKKLL